MHTRCARKDVRVDRLFLIGTHSSSPVSWRWPRSFYVLTKASRVPMFVGSASTRDLVALAPHRSTRSDIMLVLAALRQRALDRHHATNADMLVRFLPFTALIRLYPAKLPSHPLFWWRPFRSMRNEIHPMAHGPCELGQPQLEGISVPPLACPVTWHYFVSRVHLVPVPSLPPSPLWPLPLRTSRITAANSDNSKQTVSCVDWRFLLS